jgi:hypothetical protein
MVRRAFRTADGALEIRCKTCQKPARVEFPGLNFLRYLAGSAVLAAFQSIAMRTRRSTDGCE